MNLARYQPKADKDFFKEPVIVGFDALVFFRKANAATDIR